LLAQKFARTNKIPVIAGSDAHWPDEVGLSCTFANCELELDSILKKIRRGEAQVGGRTLPLPTFLWRAFQKLLLRMRGKRGGGGLSPLPLGGRTTEDASLRGLACFYMC
jgi:hypothetical protein